MKSLTSFLTAFVLYFTTAIPQGFAQDKMLERLAKQQVKVLEVSTIDIIYNQIKETINDPDKILQTWLDYDRFNDKDRKWLNKNLKKDLVAEHVSRFKATKINSRKIKITHEDLPPTVIEIKDLTAGTIHLNGKYFNMKKYRSSEDVYHALKIRLRKHLRPNDKSVSLIDIIIQPAEASMVHALLLTITIAAVGTVWFVTQKMGGLVNVVATILDPCYAESDPDKRKGCFEEAEKKALNSARSPKDRENTQLILNESKKIRGQ